MNDASVRRTTVVLLAAVGLHGVSRLAKGVRYNLFVTIEEEKEEEVM